MTNLVLPVDDVEGKFKLAWECSAQLGSLPPIYVITHKRADTLPTLKTLPMLRWRGLFVVAEEELETYRAAHPELVYLPIPAGYRGLERGVGRARQFCLDTADLLGQEHILIMDDDLTSLSVLYGIGPGKVSHAYTRLVGDQREAFHAGLLVLFSQIAEEAYGVEPTAVIASPQCNNANRTTGSSETRWELNRGGPPAQIQSWRADRFTITCGELDLDNFNLHGDDIAVAAQVIAAGGSIVNVPSLIGQYLDYETESVIRTPETAPALRAAEHEALMAREIAPFIKTRTDLLDRPMWHSLDWKTLHARGLVKTTRILWKDELS